MAGGVNDIRCLVAFADVPPQLAGIVAYRAHMANVSLKTLRSSCKRDELVAIRRKIALEAREQGFSLWQIGRALNRDHSTVRYTIEKAKEAA